MHIMYVDAPCGAGKTFAAEGYVGELARPGPARRKFVISQPNTTLINQTAGNIHRRHPAVPVTVIHTETHRGDVVRAIDAHLKAVRPGGEVLLISQQAFARLGHFRNAQEWHLIVDEIPQVHAGFSLRLARNNYLLTQLIQAEPHDEAYVRLTGTDAPHLDEVAANKARDNVWGLFSDLVAKARHPDWQVYCPAATWERFLHNAEPGADVADLEAFALLDPSIYNGFASMTLMGANFADSLLHRIWSARGVEFTPHPRIKPSWPAHPNGHLLSIYYVAERAWSKTLRQTGKDLLGRIARAVEVRMAGEPFLWLANNDVRVSPFRPGVGDVRLPNSPYGLNQYAHIHNAVILSALNPSPAYFSFLKHMAGLDSNTVRAGIYLETVYQSVSRISLRDRASTARKTAVVMDRDAGEWLKALYPGASLENLTEKPIIPLAAPTGRRKEYTTTADRMRAYRARKRAGLAP